MIYGIFKDNHCIVKMPRNSRWSKCKYRGECRFHNMSALCATPEQELDSGMKHLYENDKLKDGNISRDEETENELIEKIAINNNLKDENVAKDAETDLLSTNSNTESESSRLGSDDVPLFQQANFATLTAQMNQLYANLKYLKDENIPTEEETEDELIDVESPKNNHWKKYKDDEEIQNHIEALSSIMNSKRVQVLLALLLLTKYREDYQL